MRLLVSFSLLGLVALTGCGRADGKVKGVAPKGEPRTVLAVKAGDTPQTVTLRGKLVEKCPVAGCWFRLQDNTGMIKVDTKTAKFVVTDIPLQTTVTVSGKLAQEENEPILQATGLRY